MTTRSWSTFSQDGRSCWAKSQEGFLGGQQYAVESRDPEEKLLRARMDRGTIRTRAHKEICGQQFECNVLADFDTIAMVTNAFMFINISLDRIPDRLLARIRSSLIGVTAVGGEQLTIDIVESADLEGVDAHDQR